MTKTLGIIGAGMIGGTVARLAVAAGLDVVLSNSRGPESLSGLAAELSGLGGGQVRAATPAGAARDADLVVAAVPLHALALLPTRELAGRTVVDAMNHYPERDGDLTSIGPAGLTSSELVQHRLPDSRVVKGLNNVFFRHLLALARPAGAFDRSALPIAGDHPGAKEETTRFLDLLGYDTVDYGTLADGWRTEPGTPAQAMPYMLEPPEGLAPAEMQQWIFQAPAAPASTGTIRRILDTTVRIR
ncbi:NADPH-dependent F420 reductase [Streptomyces tsukubensis]|uniref:NADPH-dependent F420 reductase n=1 Tax=Streptomyces tsukubensis TaxID=83656 RepID=UPI0036A55C90